MAIYCNRDPVWCRRGTKRLWVECGTVGPMLVTLVQRRRWIPRSRTGADMERLSPVLRVRIPPKFCPQMYGDVKPETVVGLLISNERQLSDGREVLHCSRSF